MRRRRAGKGGGLLSALAKLWGAGGGLFYVEDISSEESIISVVRTVKRKEGTGIRLLSASCTYRKFAGLILFLCSQERMEGGGGTCLALVVCMPVSPASGLGLFDGAGRTVHCA